MRLTSGFRLASVATSMFVLGACERGAVTEPAPDAGPGIELIEFQPQFVSEVPTGPAITVVPHPRPFPGTKVQGQAAVCKSSASPAGSYTFSVSATGTQTGDLVASSVTLSPGQCSVVFNRANRTGFAVTSVTITETIPGGAAFALDSVVADDDASGRRRVTGPAVTVLVNGQHGAFATFYNRSTGHPAPPPPPPPGHPPTTQGQVQVCKAGSATGSFNFTIIATGTGAGDVLIPGGTASLAAGQCATVFTRVAAGPAATVTITESARAGFTLTGATVNGSAVASLGGTVVVTESNSDALKVVTFTNVAVTLGASLPFSVTPATGQVKLCKHGGPAGTFNFNVAVAGAVATDQILSSTSLTAGTCKVIFVRAATIAGSAAVITVTELNATGFVTTSQNFTVSGGGTVNAGVVAVATENVVGSGTVIVFTNVALTVGSHARSE